MVRSMASRAASPMLHLDLNEIGGGKVVWPFRMVEPGPDGKPVSKEVRRGTELTAEQIRAITPANRTSLIGRFIRVWPKASGTADLASAVNGDGASGVERHVVTLGFRRFCVIEGKRLNDGYLTREEAYALAGKTEKPRRKRGDKEH